MIISEVYLENIRSHQKTSINFVNGINVITGNTGSGKSSILIAVEYALFGKIGEGKEEGKILLRRNSKEGEIKLTISDINDKYEISRGLKRVNESVRNDDSKNYIIKNGLKVDLQNRASDINAYLTNNILRIDSDNPLKMFETITYIKQDELKNLILETGQYKQEYIDGLLQLNKYLILYENMREIINDIKTEIELEKKEIEIGINEEDIIKIEQKINQNKELILDIERRINENKITLENKKINEKQKESQVRFERDKKIKFEKISTEIKIKKEEIENLKLDIKKINENIENCNKKLIKFDEKRKESIDKELERLEDEFKSKNDEGKNLYAELYKIEYYLKNALKEKENILLEEKETIKRIDSLKKEKEEIEKQIIISHNSGNKDEINGRILELEKSRDKLRAEMEDSLKNMICKLCGSKITDVDHIKNEYTIRINYHDKRIEDLKEDYKNIKISKNELEKKLENLSVRIIGENEKLNKINEKLLNLNIEDQRSKYEDLKAKYNDYTQEIASLDNNIKKLREESNYIHEQEKNIIEIKNYTKRLTELEQKTKDNIAKLNKLNSDILEIEFNEENLDNAEKELRIIAEEINELNSNIRSLEKEKEIRNKEVLEDIKNLKDVEIKMKKKKEMTNKIIKEEQLFKLLSNLREDIRSIREYVRLKFIDQFRSLFKERFEELRDENEYSIDIDKNYNVIINSGNEESDVRALSGGEKTSVAIAYRLALSSLASILGGIGKNELIIMDEPTSGLDKEDINALTNAITKISDLKQIIIVTHEESMKNIADKVIKLRKTGGISILY